MYGVPKDLDLGLFVGDYLTQVSIGAHGLHFVFGKGSSIYVQGGWELKNSSGIFIDGATEQREFYKVHVLLHAVVTGTKIDAPRSFTLLFDNGMTLTVFDDSAQYESFSIQPGNIYV